MLHCVKTLRVFGQRKGKLQTRNFLLNLKFCATCRDEIFYKYQNKYFYFPFILFKFILKYIEIKKIELVFKESLFFNCLKRNERLQ